MTAPRNPSELARLEDEYDFYTEKLHDNCLGKSSKAAALVECRRLERLLGLESKPYNGS